MNPASAPSKPNHSRGHNGKPSAKSNGNALSNGNVNGNGNAQRQPLSKVRELFRRFAQATSSAVGSPWAFVLAVVVIVAWAVTGPIFRFSDTWQLIINTGTTIVTFLMVFMIQSSQNRDARAIQLKLDELIRSKRGARNKLVDLENCSDEELAEIEEEFRRIKSKAARAKDAAVKHGDDDLHGELHEIEQSVREVEETVKDTRRST
jgi:low affinity Fe/Cu permease